MAFERKIHVRLLISCWGSTSPDTFPFLRSLSSLKDPKSNLDIQVVSNTEMHAELSQSVTLVRKTEEVNVSKLSWGYKVSFHVMLFLLHFLFPRIRQR